MSAMATRGFRNLCGNEIFKGTLYGPAEFLSDKAKRYRMMNREEQMKYDRKVKASQGFDVDGCTGCMPGRIVPLLPSAGVEWEFSTYAAKFAAEECARVGGPSLKFVQLDKANMQPVQGCKYFLTFIAEEGAEHVRKTYRAKVWAGRAGHQLLGLTEYEIPRKAGNGGSSSKGSLRSGNSAEAKLKKGRHSGLALARFRELVQDIRRKYPELTYAAARKKASEKWKSMKN